MENERVRGRGEREREREIKVYESGTNILSNGPSTDLSSLGPKQCGRPLASGTNQ